MRTAKLLHNPGAGDEEHSKEELIEMIKANGFECRYSSTKEIDEDDFKEDVDFLVVAGGDGTIRKITKVLLDAEGVEKTFPIAVLPLGTANNISKTLGIQGDPAEIISKWQKAKVRKYDVGRVSHMKESMFFLESFGYGIFPELMKQMEKVDKEKTFTPEKKIQTALELLHEIILSFEAKDCTLLVDEQSLSGKYLLAEIMNTRSIGPNLYLSPDSEPGDGYFEVVLVSEEDREKLTSYVMNKIKGVEETYSFQTLKAREVHINWHGNKVHVDDETIDIEDYADVKIALKAGLLKFLV